jgi:thioredoxin 1
VLGPILKEVKDNLGDGISIIKSMSIKPRNSIQVSGGVPTMILFKGKQLWRESGVLDKTPSLKSLLEVINDKIALISKGILVGAVAGYLYRYMGCIQEPVSSHPNRLIPLYMGA